MVAIRDTWEQCVYTIHMWLLYMEKGKHIANMFHFHPAPMLGDHFLTMAYAKTLLWKQ